LLVYDLPDGWRKSRLFSTDLKVKSREVKSEFPNAMNDLENMNLIAVVGDLDYF
jgi:hypothetical protein